MKVAMEVSVNISTQMQNKKLKPVKYIEVRIVKVSSSQIIKLYKELVSSINFGREILVFIFFLIIPFSIIMLIIVLSIVFFLFLQSFVDVENCKGKRYISSASLIIING